MRRAEFNFCHEFPCGVSISLKQPVTFPLRYATSLLFQHIITKHKIPEFAHNELMNSLQRFIEQERNFDFIESYSNLLNTLLCGSIDLNALCDRFDQAYRKHVSSYSEPTLPSDDELFSQAFHRVVHSPNAKELMRLQHSFALAVCSEVDKKNSVLQRLDDELMRKTEDGLQNSGPDISRTLTQMQESHIRERELQESRYNSCISELKRIQRRELRNFVMSLEEHHSSLMQESQPHALLAGQCEKQFHSSNLDLSYHRPNIPASVEPWTRSFTVQLGRQVRTTCNFRLVRANPENLLNNFSLSSQQPQSSERLSMSSDDLAARLGNALTLYSNDLSGLVVIVDKRINSFRGINRRLAEACERSTEFHFPDLDCQLASIQDTIDRLGTRLPGTPSDESSSNSTSTDNPEHCRKPREPMHGDVYITKHSNLAGGDGFLAGTSGGISVVFHLVQNESLDRDEGRIRSGTPLHCALSAILRTCFDYDITTLSLPLLLVPTIRENMDQQWRARRAESVFKALKGALMDLSTWRGPTLRSIQFLAPVELSDIELESFAHTINTSFLQPVPVVVPC